MGDRVLILDGGMGTMLQARGLGAGEHPESFGIQHKEAVIEVHKAYLRAGADVLYTNTFGANVRKLADCDVDVRTAVCHALDCAKTAISRYRAEEWKHIHEKMNGLENRVFAGNAKKLPSDMYSDDAKHPESIHANRRIYIALDIGPIGELLEPLGTLKFEDAYEIYKEVVTIGQEHGADILAFETFTDLYDLKAAVLAAKENTSLKIFATMSFEANGRTFTGTEIASMAMTLDGLGVDALGFNCSLGPREMLLFVRELRTWTNLPMIVKPNAGLPDPKTGVYNVSAKDFGRDMHLLKELGVEIMGGCCGTTPEYIRALVDNVNLSEDAIPDGDSRKDRAICLDASIGKWDAKETGFNLEELKPRKNVLRHGVCSATKVCELNGVLVVGERLNPTGKKRFAQALLESDFEHIEKVAIEEEEAGADILDVNVGVPGADEVQLMIKTVKAVQGIVSLPLQIDSSNPKAVEAGLRVCNGRAIINSVNADDEKLATILPIAKKYGASIVGLAMDENGLPQTCEQRLVYAKKILETALSYGLRKEDVIIDCLTLTVSAQQNQAKETLEAVRRVSKELGLHTTLGVSNISFGLPARKHINESFLTQAMHWGLDLPIMNPCSEGMMDAVAAFRVLSGEDIDSAKYIERFATRHLAMQNETSGLNMSDIANAKNTTSKPAVSNAMTSQSTTESAKHFETPDSNVHNAAQGNENMLPPVAGSFSMEDAILKGLRDETKRLTANYLETMSELDVINRLLIPALDVVGERYEKQIIFLPQLINAANAACAGFDLIKERIAKRGGESISKGKIIIATVRGDIHDIGKNIVKVILENYGYRMIDLGRDVPVEDVVNAVLKEDVSLVGLSALMTTTLPSMAKTIAEIKKAKPDCKVWVGGAVLTNEYAMEIGADYYARDARASVDIARKVLG